MQAPRLRIAAALVGALLAGLILQVTAPTAALHADGAATASLEWAMTAEHETVAAVVGPHLGGNAGAAAAWRQALLRTTTGALAGLLVLAALLAADRRRRVAPVLVWRLVRPDQRPATVRHRSPL